ncbi:hypothetical protein GIB67_000150 [Kingdonia uniflora]|uniref:Protein SCAR n=1 Tax=Kingdonia uniflora TaxID=39325 RepID=A0A7J7P9H1_9MAGN|nr:hypothetical protein GIB67_000150 [Kingdonia uniflora]
MLFIEKKHRSGVGSKLSLQRTGPFHIIQRIGENAYELDLPRHMRRSHVVNVSLLSLFVRDHVPSITLLIPLPQQHEFDRIDSVLERSTNETSKRGVYHMYKEFNIVGIFLKQLRLKFAMKDLNPINYLEVEYNSDGLSFHRVQVYTNRLAAEVFHDLQEQVIATTARSRNITARVKHLEAKVPPLEKAVMEQRSRVHLAYTAGSEWHSKIRTEQNLLINSELPPFIMDSYEQCRDPPRLHLLDKFGTEGPGACLRKYSDPSFFKKALANSESAKSQKVQREVRAYNSMKGVARRSNGELSNVVSISKNSNRMPFSSSNRYGRNSIAETISISHIRSKSEPVEQATSFYSRTNSGHIECDVSSSMRFNCRERREFSISRLRMDNSKFVSDEQRIGSFNELTRSPLLEKNVSNSSSVSCDDEFVYLEEQNGGSFDNSSHVSCQEKVVPNLSPVTWVEKTEILWPNSQKSSNVFRIEGEPSELKRESDRLRNIDTEDDIMYVGVIMQEPLSSRNQIDGSGAGSVSENFVDAFNQLESETETDSECQTKREVGLSSARSRRSNDEVTECRPGLMQGVTAPDSEVPNIEPQIASNSLSYGSMPQSFLNSFTSEDLIQAHSPELSVSTSNQFGSELSESRDCLDVSRVKNIEYAICDTVSGFSDPNSQSLSGGPIHAYCESPHVETSNDSPVEVPITVGLCKSQESSMIIRSLSKSQQSGDACSGASSVAVWTNGGLLGLQPSKPPESRMLNAVDHSLVTSKDEKHDILINNINMSHSNESTRKLDTASEQIEQNPEPLTDITTQAHLPSILDVNGPASGADPENIVNSSGKSGVSQRLLVNDFQNEVSFGHDNRFDPRVSLKTKLMKLYELEHKGICQYHALDPNEQPEDGSPVNSPFSSPPLEHMKISFHPINGFGTSQLKLKFPWSIKDFMFPTFQLLPTHATPLKDIESGSGDDTFYRSSPCTSDELLREHSVSSSDQWDYSETPGNMDLEIYDSLHRVSSAQSISNDFELEGIVRGNNSCSSNFKSPDIEDVLLPVFGYKNPLTMQKDEKCDSKPTNHPDSAFECFIEPISLPTPPPPMQWMELKPNSDVAENKEGAFNYPDPLQFLGANASHKPVPDLPKKQLMKEKTTVSLHKSKDQERLNGCEKANQAAYIGHDTDQREELLHQIRTMSFSLKRTVPGSPTIRPGPTANLEMAVMFEKVTPALK